MNEEWYVAYDTITKQWFSSDDGKPFNRLYQNIYEINDALDESDAISKAKKLQKLHRSLPLEQRCLLEELKQKNFIDFSDIEHGLGRLERLSLYFEKKHMKDVRRLISLGLLRFSWGFDQQSVIVKAAAFNPALDNSERRYALLTQLKLEHKTPASEKRKRLTPRL